MKHSKIKLIRDFFAPVTMDEMKALLPKDRDELASGICRSMGIPEAQCDFKHVDY